MHHIEPTHVLLPVHDDTRTPHVTSTGDHHDVASVEVDKVDDLVLLKVELDGVVGLDSRVRVPDRAPVVGDDMGDALGADSDFADFEELVGGLLRGDAVDRKAALDIVEQTEVLAGFLDGNDIWENSDRAQGEGTADCTHLGTRWGRSRQS